jgi:pimeloyl-ACP methyl ester carboxylesterase
LLELQYGVSQGCSALKGRGFSHAAQAIRETMKFALGAEPGLPHTRSIEEHWITINGGCLRYLHAGSGPPLLLIHGLLGYSFSWRYAIPALARNSEIYALDMLGVGFSDRPAAMDCSLRACAQRLLDFMDKAGHVSCDLLGSSHGGAVAMMAAALGPDRVRRLILVSPVNPWSAHRKHLIAFLRNPLLAPIVLALAPHLQIFYGVYLRRLYGDTRRIRPGTLEGYSEPLRLPGAFNYSLAVLSSWKQDMWELESELPGIAQIPTLLIWGSLDAAVDPASGARLEHQFRNCRLLMLEGVGHVPYEEVPEEFNRAVAEFLCSR